MSTTNSLSLRPRGEGRGEGPVAALLTLISSSALACSGPGAADAIAISSLIGWLFGALSIAATVLIVRRKPKMWLRALAIVLAVLHPGWWMSVLAGDCGYSLRLVAPVYFLLHVGLALLARRAPKPS